LFSQGRALCGVSMGGGMAYSARAGKQTVGCHNPQSQCTIVDCIRKILIFSSSCWVSQVTNFYDSQHLRPII